ncbi:TetR/AcrR family transcriptional regulator [Nocardia carnea]|uniref:TetR/AcrR family transcriptional regulator n=1 Tax=Nocardia carnea TaxID=37328 RepID=UPI0024539F64|nr:TetR family transcriptional regulator [Nocardia carnea]
MAKETVWDRQRAAVRSEIVATALEMFSTDGFDETPIDRIVETVGVSRRTFFRYFGTKEDIVLGGLIARGEVIAGELANRPAAENPWEALLAALHAAHATLATDKNAELALGKMLYATPSLRARLIEKRLRWQEMFVPLLATRMDGPTESATLRATAIVAAALACLDTASQAWIASDGAADLADLYDEAVTAVRG